MKQILLVILCLILVCNAAGADTATVQIRLYEEQIYFLNDNVQIKLTVQNDSVNPYHFRVADNRVFSFDFDVRTLENRPAQFHSDVFKSNRNSGKPVFYREIDLAQGEEYSLVLNMNDYIKFPNAGLYQVQVNFYPGLYIDESSPVLVSNRLSVNIRPPVDSLAARQTIEAQIDKSLQREVLPPDKVVAYTLNARKLEPPQWSKFFLYINLEALYLNSYLDTQANRDQYNKLSEEDKRTRIAAYQNQITGGKAEWYLVLRPSSFEIRATSYTGTDATVKVEQVFQHPDYQEPRFYTYTLRRYNPDGPWEIVNYAVENANLGTR